VFSAFDKILGSEAPYGYLLSRHLSSELQRQFLLRSFRLSSIRQRAVARLYQSGRIDQHCASCATLREQAAAMSQRLDEHLGDHVTYRPPSPARHSGWRPRGRGHAPGVPAPAGRAGGDRAR
jgi:DNA-binding transcriptional MocR family regulator